MKGRLGARIFRGRAARPSPSQQRAIQSAAAIWAAPASSPIPRDTATIRRSAPSIPAGSPRPISSAVSRVAATETPELARAMNTP